MKYIFMFTVIGFVAQANATYLSSSACIAQANMHVTDTYHGAGKDGKYLLPALFFDWSGNTQISDKSRIVSQETKDGVETITYKVKEPRMKLVEGKYVTEIVEVRKTIHVTRKNGQLASIVSDFDMAAQKKQQEEWAKNSKAKLGEMPVSKSYETRFTGTGEDCKTEQITHWMDDKGQAKGNVFYDKKACDSLAPLMKKMGHQNASECGNLMMQAAGIMDIRRGELKSENKELNPSYVTTVQKPDLNSTFEISNFVTACASEGLPMGMFPGMGMYGPFGTRGLGGMGMMGPGSMPKAGDAQTPVR
ncbi:MAG: hypothetical protein BroJett040_18450 [Oligoflexia bacterium]|nr:MAG: hypothetical protein BroJett040_18450 [Oligoflexia bacterium]